MPTASPAFERWLLCREKTCCSYYVVYPTGGEIVGLTRALGIAADELVVPLPTEQTRTAYRLSVDGSPYRLALVRTRLGDGPSSCGFLVRLPDGTARCGLGAQRPQRCRVYPAIRTPDGGLGADARGCTCGPWTPRDFDGAVELEAIGRLESDYARYAAIVTAWNVGLLDLPAIARTHREFLAFVSDAYAR